MLTAARSNRACGLRRAAALAVVLALAATAAPAQRKERLGKDVVDAACASCHLSGKDKAPKIGDTKAWAPRASQGLSALTEHALKGIRNMPAHGGAAGVSDIEIERAIVYMVNKSGGHWVEPIGGATPALLRTSDAVVRDQCAKCHASGQDGAPKIGDRPAWTPRLKKGLDALVASAIHGHGAMPARGGLPDLSDQEIRGAIIAMFNAGLPETPTVPAAAPSNPNHKLVSGTDIYLGMMRAETVRAAAPGDKSLGDVPSGKGYYHINISLVDNRSQVQVTDATVKLKVSDGMRSETRTLDLVGVNRAVSYGGWFQLAGGSQYNITADVRRPGQPTPIEAKFAFKAP